MPSNQESPDCSNGYEAFSAEFIRRRDQSAVGVGIVRSWAQLLPAGASILDLGCGHGVPISAALIKEGFTVYGVDASDSLASEFRRRFPHTPVACEAAEGSSFFHRTFDGIIAIGLIFLLAPEAQRRLLRRVAPALNGRGRFLFTAPTQRATWRDILTGRQSVSLGAKEYKRLLSEAGLLLEHEYVDEGENHYYASIKQ